MDAEKQSALSLTRVFDAPRALVFRLWSEPAHLARWWGPQGFAVKSVEMDFRVGGAWKVCLHADAGFDFWMGGEYREIRAPERLVFTFKWEAAHGKPKLDTVATITLTEQGGKTRLDLHQAPFQALDARAAHQGGWGDTLDRLAAYLAEVELSR
ncbi:SRPBCC domain-containing protein [Desertibaculum subflavum]|uniref:SRPBCC domain-containing protein n=1 Tax=Desertibaculum subflavum TaxID=2268458 RepID=UPI000E6701A0